ncbi:uncharacterized protein LOC116653124 [Coturnix japonica]|uniref:uncharacterized protein LOC116653124 n=1 Tax=Coturnix japonica TaxID=93934 RepID=UPI0013A5DC69|nr:uncharacterized protein LOC116653124 [Coturnix japonica]
MPQARNRLKPVQTGRFHLGLVFSPWRRGAFGNLRPPPSERSHWSRAMAPSERPARSLGGRHVNPLSPSEACGERAATSEDWTDGIRPLPDSARGAGCCALIGRAELSVRGWPAFKFSNGGRRNKLPFYWFAARRRERGLCAALPWRVAFGPFGPMGRCVAAGPLCCRWLWKNTAPRERGGGGGLCCDGGLYLTAALASGSTRKMLKIPHKCRVGQSAGLLPSGKDTTEGPPTISSPVPRLTSTRKGETSSLFRCKVGEQEVRGITFIERFLLEMKGLLVIIKISITM